MQVYLPLYFWLAVLLCPLPFLIQHCAWMWKQEQYHYLPALALVFGLLLFQRCSFPLGYVRNRRVRAIVTVGFLMLGGAVWLGSPWLGTLAWTILLGAFLYSQDDKSAARTLVHLWPLSWLVLPLPMGLDSALTAWLQLQSSRLSSYLMDWWQLPHNLLGNIIELPQGRLFVEEACSGVQSLFTLVFCAFAIVIAFGRPLLLLPAYALAAVLWAALLNVARIFTIAYVRVNYQWDWSEGWKHATLGYFFLAAAVILLLSTDRLFRVLFFPTNPLKFSSKRSNPFVQLWNGCLADVPPRLDAPRNSPPQHRVTLALGFALSGLLLATQLTNRAMSYAASPVARERGTRFLEVAKDLQLPAEAGFKQESHTVVEGDISLPFGENADIWRGFAGVTDVSIALSQPYPVWHDLCICYSGAGWTLNDRSVVYEPTTDGSDAWGIVEARWISANGRYAYLWFSAFDSDGSIVAPPESSLADRWKFYVQGRDSVRSVGGRIAMIQTVVESDAVLSPDISLAVRRVHDAARQVLRSQALKSRNQTSPN